jgi:hypothetical protein
MSDIKINDSMWHPCNMDIIEHKVISIRQFDCFNHYVLKAVRNVGACGRLEVIVSENNGKLRFVELVNEDTTEYASGLQDFIEGNYYTTKEQAELEFYEQQRILTWSSMESKKNYMNRHWQITIGLSYWSMLLRIK